MAFGHVALYSYYVGSDFCTLHCRVVVNLPTQSHACQRIWRTEVPENHPARWLMNRRIAGQSITLWLRAGRQKSLDAVFMPVILNCLLFRHVLPLAFGEFTAGFGTSVWRLPVFFSRQVSH